MNNNNHENIQETKIDQVQNVEQTTKTPDAQPNIPEQIEDPDWRAVREQRKADRKAREEADKRAAEKAAEAEALRAALEAITNKPSNNRNEYSDHEESDDEKIRKRVDEIIKEREELALKQRFEQEKTEYPKRLRQTHKDFDTVCDPENLDYLEYHFPEIAAPFRYMPEGFDKWDSIYKAAKRLIPNLNVKQDQKRMEKNLSKPGSISSTGTTQGLSNNPTPHILTDQKKAENWALMQRRLKGLS